MYLSFDQVPCHDATELGLCHYTGDENMNFEFVGDPWMDIERSLCNYMSKKGEWNESCVEWFGGESDEYDYDEDDDEGDQDEDDQEEGGSEEGEGD